MSAPFFSLNLATINFFCTRWARNKRGGALSWHSTQLTRQLCALIKQVVWKHSIWIIQEYLQAFFLLLEKGGIHKIAGKAKIFPALVAFSCVVLCCEGPVLCCHGLLCCLVTVGTLAFISTMLFSDTLAVENGPRLQNTLPCISIWTKSLVFGGWDGTRVLNLGYMQLMNSNLSV